MYRDRSSGENRDVIMTFFRKTKVLNTFYKSKVDYKIVPCDNFNNRLQSIYLKKSENP